MTAIVIDSNVKSVRAKEFVANDKTFARTGNMIETGPTSHTICDVVNLQGNSVAIENYILLSPFPNSLSYYCRKVTVNKMIAFTGTSKVSLVYLPLGIDTPDDGVKTVISSTVFNGGSIGTPIVNATMEPPLAYTTIYTTGNSPIGYVVAKDPGIVGTNISLKIVLGTATTPVISSVYIDDNKRLDYPKGIVVNGSIYAEELNYPHKNGPTYLLGIKYAPLRKEFWEVPEKKIKKRLKV